MGGMTVSSPEGEMMICRMAVIVSGFTLVLDLNLGPAEGAIQQGNCCLDPGALGLASCRDLVERANGVHAQLAGQLDHLRLLLWAAARVRADAGLEAERVPRLEAMRPWG